MAERGRFLSGVHGLLHSLQHLKAEVQNCAFFGDLSTVTTKYLRVWRPASAFKIHSKGCKSNGEA